MSMIDRSKREIVEHYKAIQSQMGLQEMRLAVLEEENVRLRAALEYLGFTVDLPVYAHEFIRKELTAGRSAGGAA